MTRRVIPLTLVLLTGCTGARVAIGPTQPETGSGGTIARLGTSLEMEVGPSEYVGSLRASGTLRDQTGQPIAGATIRVTLTPLEGPGTLESYSLTGTVPAGAVRATAGLRVNTECGCAGETDLSLYDVDYEQGAMPTSLVPDGDFARGLDGWRVGGSGLGEVRRSDRGSGSMLLARASARQALSADSPQFGVRPAQPFTVTFSARVAPKSEGSGYFTVLFLSSSGEVARERIPFAPASFDLGTRTTDETGFFRATFHPPGVYLHLGRLLVQAWFDGDERYQPAKASGTIQG